MCGILGCLPAVDEPAFKRALNLLAHRGPDGEGVWKDADSRVMLGHRRLAILDTSAAAAQPFHYQHVVITFNGCIYNYLELKKELEQKGHRFTTTSDTEVLAASYLEWGTDCVHHFNGMWAFGIWDQKEQSLFLSRDRFGEKPLYYTQLADNTFCFASEMKALAPLMDRFEPADDFNWLVENYMDYEATDRCLIKGIERLQPGYSLICKDGRLNYINYWYTLQNIRETPDKYEDQVAQFRELLDDAIKLRLRSDVPLGCSLSGGLDSSVVTALADANFQAGRDKFRPTAFTATFEGSVVDELKYAKILTGERGMQQQIVAVDAEAALAKLADDIWYLEDVYRNPPSPMMRLYEGYRKQKTYVSLEGHGPDELFSGYGNFVMLAMLDAGLDLKQLEEITAVYEGMIPEDNGMVKRKKGGLLGYLRTQLWYKGQKAGQTWEGDSQKAVLEEKLGVFNAGLYRLFHQQSFPTLMRNYDRYAMHAGVEVRMPFTDHRLVSFCFGLPWQSKIGHGYSKRILRDATRDVLPDSIVNRKSKVGFQTPTVEWFKGPWKTYLEDMLNSSDFRQTAGSGQVLSQFQALMKNNKATVDDADQFWLKISPYLWRQHFLKPLQKEVRK